MNNHSLSPPSKVKENSRLNLQAAFPCLFFLHILISGPEIQFSIFYIFRQTTAGQNGIL